MLKARLMTVAVLVGVVVPALLFLPSVAVAGFLLVVSAIAAFEWQRLSGCRSPVGAWGYPVLIGAICLVLAPLALGHQASPVLLGIAALWWLGVTAYLVRHRDLLPHPVGRWRGLLTGALAIVPSWYAMVHMHEVYGSAFLLYTFALVWVADSGAYFAGKNLGRVKLAPAISPGKTIEGVIGGMVAVAIYGLLGGWVITGTLVSSAILALISIPVALLSVSGDLLVSLFKRQRGTKDSGRLLPGHGGVLDRVDSLLAAAPLMLLGFEALAGRAW